MQCLRINLLALVLALIAACSNAPNGPVVLPYIEAVLLKEKLANQEFAYGNYPEALAAYNVVYGDYRNLDSHDNMARLLSNHFQTALIIEDIASAKGSALALENLLQQYQSVDYQQRLVLLKANLALVQQQWPKALDILNTLDTSNANSATALASQVSRLVAQFQQGDDISASLQQLELKLSTYPALLARTWRLQGLIAIQNDNGGNATRLITQAKRYYQGITFPLGVAECLVLEAKLAEQQQQISMALILRERAKAIFINMGNNHALQRHQL